MILIGRGLDLSQRVCVMKKEVSKREEAESWSDKAESQACAVLRVRIKPIAAPNKVRREPVRLASGDTRKAAAIECKLSLRRSHSEFPVTIA